MPAVLLIVALLVSLFVRTRLRTPGPPPARTPDRQALARQLAQRCRSWRGELEPVRDDVPSWAHLDRALDDAARLGDRVGGTADAAFRRLHPEAASYAHETPTDAALDMGAVARHLVARVDAARLAVHLRQAVAEAQRVHAVQTPHCRDLPAAAFDGYTLGAFVNHVRSLERAARSQLERVVAPPDSGLDLDPDAFDSGAAQTTLDAARAALDRIRALTADLAGKRDAFDRAQRSLSDLGYFRGYAAAAAVVARHPAVSKRLGVAIERAVDRIQTFDPAAFANDLEAAAELVSAERALQALVAGALPSGAPPAQSEQTTASERAVPLLDRELPEAESGPTPLRRVQTRS